MSVVASFSEIIKVAKFYKIESNHMYQPKIKTDPGFVIAIISNPNPLSINTNWASYLEKLPTS